MIEKIKDLLAKQLRIDVNTITDNTNIIEDLGADSLDIVEMLMAIEEKFGVNVPDEDVPQLKTVKNVAEYIEANEK
ncbi:Acyl carrier protein [bioreactor metagenome]|uniref:Acyl carrier protein n=1 Tax=bioreactor metagenome TaxID=1076179 RepID=A0A645C316_9ZZZZ|nr:acyl carrier protein [Oscillospiraceae bacterium]